MLKPYLQRPTSSLLSDPSTKSYKSTPSESTISVPRKQSILQLKQILLVTKGMREQLDKMRGSIGSFEALVPNQYKMLLQNDKENVNVNMKVGTGNIGKLHLCETKAGSNLRDLSPASRRPLKPITLEKGNQNQIGG